jgi:hypothetical protein
MREVRGGYESGQTHLIWLPPPGRENGGVKVGYAPPSHPQTTFLWECTPKKRAYSISQGYGSAKDLDFSVLHKKGTNLAKLMMTIWADYGKLRLCRRLASLASQIQENLIKKVKGVFNGRKPE